MSTLVMQIYAWVIAFVFLVAMMHAGMFGIQAKRYAYVLAKPITLLLPPAMTVSYLLAR